ncbi:hypothetical protein [Psychrobacter sp. LV10R520-6]|uniref:hypothetical protein n=1 Tax=Psychrobacter sp. LV10R520-6 TaxID=1415574 RepID=UPI0024CD6EE8|nr:hypothetical protein [Psychrobacter sp. LV10R520-6]SNT69983.1 hypothetical protein SAMN04488491_1112 [Psychrobacter sp. LV10R520-6]
MEPLSIASFSLAAILASLPVNGKVISKPTITTHISPAIAGQWEIDLNSTDTISKRTGPSADRATTSNEPKVIAGQKDGVLDQSERRTINVVPSSIGASNIKPNTKNNASQNISASAKSTQCRELYNFGADNEMWAVSGKEWTYGRYLVTHREEGLPIIAIKTIYDNNEKDCSGNQVDQSDEALIAFLNHDGNRMQWCADPDGKKCYMNFHRVLP